MLLIKFKKCQKVHDRIVQKQIIILLDNTPNQPSKFRTRNMFEINDDSHGTYKNNSQIKFKTVMLKSSLCNYSNANWCLKIVLHLLIA